MLDSGYKETNEKVIKENKALNSAEQAVFHQDERLDDKWQVEEKLEGIRQLDLDDLDFKDPDTLRTLASFIPNEDYFTRISESIKETINEVLEKYSAAELIDIVISPENWQRIQNGEIPLDNNSNPIFTIDAPDNKAVIKDIFFYILKQCLPMLMKSLEKIIPNPAIRSMIGVAIGAMLILAQMDKDDPDFVLYTQSRDMDD